LSFDLRGRKYSCDATASCTAPPQQFPDIGGRLHHWEIWSV
jgi:hypothetical protein